MVQVVCVQELLDEAPADVHEATAVGPVGAVLQVTVWPPEVPAVQELAPTNPVSVVWQVIVCPPEELAVQEEALTQPVSVAWHSTPLAAVQEETLLQADQPLLQSTADDPPVQA